LTAIIYVCPQYLIAIVIKLIHFIFFAFIGIQKFESATPIQISDTRYTVVLVSEIQFDFAELDFWIQDNGSKNKLDSTAIFGQRSKI